MESKNRVFRLLKNAAPLSYILHSRHTLKKPLLYFDKDKGYNRELRYARNQAEIFVDAQDNNAIVEPIIFEDGLLNVPENNPILQKFLFHHPGYGKVFTEVDNEKNAEEELSLMDLEDDAIAAAREMTIEQMEAFYRVAFSKDASTVTTAEMKRDIRVYAKRDPEGFLSVVSDPNTELQSTIAVFFEQKLLAYRNNQKDVHFNLPDNKKRMMTIPYGEKPLQAIAQFFKTDEGMEIQKFLEKQLE